MILTAKPTDHQPIGVSPRKGKGKVGLKKDLPVEILSPREDGEE
jgi:hypothetical protein